MKRILAEEKSGLETLWEIDEDHFDHVFPALVDLPAARGHWRHGMHVKRVFRDVWLLPNITVY